MKEVGYEFLRRKLDLKVMPARRTARIEPVTRVERTDQTLFVPRHVAPGSDSPLEHLLFALKHEGIDMAVIEQAVRHVSGRDVVDALDRSPSGSFLRRSDSSGKLFAKGGCRACLTARSSAQRFRSSTPSST